MEQEKWGQYLDGFSKETVRLVAFGDGGERLNDYTCYKALMLPATGFWSFLKTKGEHLSTYTLPLFFVQITLAVLINRLLRLLLKPLCQTHIIPFLLGGMVLGPSFLGKITHHKFGATLFPTNSLVLFELVGIIGLIFYFFVLGVTMDFSVIKTTGKKGIFLAFADIAVTIFIASIFFIFVPSKNDVTTPSAVLGMAASMTGFPVLNRIVVQLRLSNTEMGRIATSCSIVETTFAWLLLPVVDVLTLKPKFHNGLFNDDEMECAEDKIYSVRKTDIVCMLFANFLFNIICFFVVRPVIRFIIRRTPDGESFSEAFVTFILAGVMFCGLVTDFIGSNVVFGPFLLGLVISHGSLGTTLIAKVEDFAYGIMLPLYFVVIGLRTHLDSIVDHQISMKHPFLIIFICASFAKVVLALIVSQFYKMPYLEGIILGLLLNTKGFIQLIVFSFGLDHRDLLDDKSFALAICLTLLITGMIPPTIEAIYNPTISHFVAYKRRSIQKSKGEPELRILPCIHNPKSVPAIINFLGFCQPTKTSPFFVYALHLLEQTVDYSHGPSTHIGHRTTSNSDRSQDQFDHIVKAFKNYEQAFGGGVAKVHTLTTISPYSTMHEEICNIAEAKGIALIILPFHKQQTIDGGLEETNPFFRDINDNVLNNAPCSVAIFVDRGLGGGRRDYQKSSSTNSHHIIVLFFGGPDDREALSLASKMTEKPNVSLTVLRFLPTDDMLNVNKAISNDMGVLKAIIDNERERQLDDDYINEFRKKNMVNKQSIMYKEKMVNDVGEMVRVIKSIDKIHYDLFIVGRGHGMINNPLTAGLIEFSECPELGAIGDLLASPDFTMTTTSVLIVQQYVGATNEAGSSGSGTPNNMQYCELYDNFHNFNRVSPHESNRNLFQRRVQRYSKNWN
ncbi:Cation/H+ exchanger [Macleaya cordata]|uniref:Cation/H+ exchanger n=1 Tax=Macleaya cordata TaxID=56857 RepID=A0A200QMQ7_MACCD|nr:Cation/H+ exchanger [Macleaya cordata]